MKLELIPFEAVSEFRLKSNINEYLKHYPFTFEKAINGELPEWDCYELNEFELEIYSENNIIESICCRKSLYYKGIDFFDYPVEKIILMLKINFDEVDSIYLEEEQVPHQVYEFDELGIQVWQKNNKIDAIFCS